MCCKLFHYVHVMSSGCGRAADVVWFPLRVDLCPGTQCTFFNITTKTRRCDESPSGSVKTWRQQDFIFVSSSFCLQRYLNHFAYSNTVGDDLWKHLQLVVEANNVSLPGPVSDIMNRWVLQMGFPVVTIDTTTGAVSQKHFLLDPESKVTVESPYRYAAHFIISAGISPHSGT